METGKVSISARSAGRFRICGVSANEYHGIFQLIKMFSMPALFSDGAVSATEPIEIEARWRIEPTTPATSPDPLNKD